MGIGLIGRVALLLHHYGFDDDIGERDQSSSLAHGKIYMTDYNPAPPLTHHIQFSNYTSTG